MLAIVTDMISPDRVRGRALVVPRWWLDAARAAAEASGLSLVDLAARLSAKVGRSEPWTHGTVSRFLAGKGVTDQGIARGCAMTAQSACVPAVR
jgi:hypothetical protein